MFLPCTGPLMSPSCPDILELMPTPDAALELLKKGNWQFLAGASSPEVSDRKLRLALAQAQAPFAVLVSCSDSRVPPELLFGCRLGELFTVRNFSNATRT